MAKKDKRKGISEDDMEAYKELNKDLSDPFPDDQVRGPETHPKRNFNKPHGHAFLR